MRILKSFKVFVSLLSAISITAIVGCGSGGCKSSTLEPGGVYAPTNAAGEVVYSDRELALSDASYKLAYETVQSVFKFEKDNRQALWEISPDIKKALDAGRTNAVAIDRRWAQARNTYKKNPTPEGIGTLQSILSELHRLLPVVQQQVSGISQDVNTKKLKKD